MRLLSRMVYDLSIENSKFDVEKEYLKVVNEDECFISLIDAAEDSLASKAVYNKKSEAFIKIEDASEVLKNAVLSIRFMLIRQIQITRLERPEKPIPKLKFKHPVVKPPVGLKGLLWKIWPR